MLLRNISQLSAATDVCANTFPRIHIARAVFNIDSRQSTFELWVEPYISLMKDTCHADQSALPNFSTILLISDSPCYKKNKKLIPAEDGKYVYAYSVLCSADCDRPEGGLALELNESSNPAMFFWVDIDNIAFIGNAPIASVAASKNKSAGKLSVVSVKSDNQIQQHF